MISVRDPIYRTIEIEDEFIPLINNPYFQRLRNIKQNSLLYYVFPSAKHDRFSHSLGVYHLMKRVLDNNSNIHISSQDKFNLKAAALLHDIGHGPHSHLWEELIEGFDHEEMSMKIIKEKFKLPKVAEIIGKKHSLYPLLSSVIDVDKLDYMARDSYFCGVGYGHTDVERIIESMQVIEGRIVIDAKVVSSVEHMITGRISLYKSTYYHHLVKAMDVLLGKIFLRIKDLKKEKFDVYFDEILLKFIEGQGSLEDFKYLDDTVIRFHLYKWSESKDLILKNLVQRFLNRGGFKALDPRLYSLDVKKIKKDIGKRFDIRYYFSDYRFEKEVYESELMVKKRTGELIPLSKFSLYIGRIVDIPIEVKYIIGPSEIISKLKNT